MAYSSAKPPSQETAAYLPNIFMFGFPGSDMLRIGELVVRTANDAGINQTPYALQDLTALDSGYSYPIQQKNQVQRAYLLAETAIPKVVLSGTEALLGDGIVGSTALRDKIGAFDTKGKRNGTTILLNMPPQECAGTFPATALPFVLSDGDGSRARGIQQHALGLAHEIIHYGRSAPVEIVGALIAHSLFNTPADHAEAAQHNVRMSSTSF